MAKATEILLTLIALLTLSLLLLCALTPANCNFVHCQVYLFLDRPVALGIDLDYLDDRENVVSFRLCSLDHTEEDLDNADSAIAFYCKFHYSTCSFSRVDLPRSACEVLATQSH